MDLCTILLSFSLVVLRRRRFVLSFFRSFESTIHLTLVGCKFYRSILFRWHFVRVAHTLVLGQVLPFDSRAVAAVICEQWLTINYASNDRILIRLPPTPKMNETVHLLPHCRLCCSRSRVHVHFIIFILLIKFSWRVVCSRKNENEMRNITKTKYSRQIENYVNKPA